MFGKNGSGKTNILEAISLFSKGRGLRKDKLSNIVKKNCEKFIIKSNFYNKEIDYSLVADTLKKNNRIKKILSVNNDKSKESIDKIYELTPFLYFLPETERLFLSSPASRRNFLDQLIFTYMNKYNRIINEYSKYLIERSKILCKNNYDESWLETLERNISNNALKIYSLREKQTNLLVDNLNDNLNNFDLPIKIKIKLNDKFYKNSISQEFYEKELKNNRKFDSIIGGCNIGPHKSDYIFFVNNDFPVSQLSTGQQKTIILLIYLAQCKYLIHSMNKEPIILLDEVCSHLDEINRKILMDLVETFNLQFFLTGTSKDLFSFLSTNTNFCNII